MKDEIQIKIVVKGEQTIMPINGAGYQFAMLEAKESGFVITFGHHGTPGVFIPEEMIRDAMAKFEGMLRRKEAENRKKFLEEAEIKESE